MSYKTNIEERTLKNKSFGKILRAAPQTRLAPMSLTRGKKSGRKLAEELHNS